MKNNGNGERFQSPVDLQGLISVNPDKLEGFSGGEWMIVHQYTPGKKVGYPFSDEKSLKPLFYVTIMVFDPGIGIMRSQHWFSLVFDFECRGS